MKLLIVQDYLRMGGTEKQTLFLARCALEAGYEVRLLLFRPGGALSGELAKLDVQVHVLQPFDTHLPLLAPGLGDAIEKIHPEVVLCMGRTANCYSGFIQRRFPHLHVVGTLRTGKVIFPLHHWSLGQVKAVLVNSNWWKRRMLERGFPDSKVHVVHNAMLLNGDEANRQAIRQSMREKTGAKDNTCVFLNVATFRPGKRHIHLLQICERLLARKDLDWQLWLVGEGKELKRCKRYVEHSELRRHVHFLGEDCNPIPYYLGADVAVSASREDSLPNFLVEAQSLGLPLIAYDCRGVIECCDPGSTGVVLPPDQPDIFCDTLQRIADEPEWRKKLAAGAPAFALSRFCPERQAELTLEFLSTLKQTNGRTCIALVQ